MSMEEAAAKPVGTSPFCTHLSTKKYAFLESPPRDEAELMDGSGACWCLQTMQTVGPDSEIVDPVDCRTGRTCFAPIR